MNGHAFRLIAATYTPFNHDLSVDYSAIPAYAAELVKDGIREIFVNGTTGESLSLTVDERMQAVEAWKNSGSDLELIVHVGHNCLEECQRMAKHAEQNGVGAISAMSTTFIRPRKLDDLIEYVAQIALAAPETKFYYYHIPSMSGVPVDMDAFIARACEEIPNFAGVKYTHEDLGEFAACLAKWKDTIDLMFGRDELLLPATAHGAQMAVGSFYGLVPEVFRNIIQAVWSGDLDLARAWSLYSNKLIDACIKVGVPAAGKYMLAQKGIGTGKLRLPLRELDATQKLWLQEQFDALTPPSNISADSNSSSASMGLAGGS
ncbi:dihydrodipicolinate synthase family protein [Aeoliella mucimassa]|uniref:N-acetylneuraminate lyase n=1 Tax=Aeoliella mucimassa TaxID=2527972 RepID=A0A518AMS8_9BACT|nr:dihydrodipicolinate synthase family protein [Aeoliella mucimassa]QDU56035.1 N-acetylneuraminate lyase [Aeoliella mucimassa]